MSVIKLRAKILQFVNRADENRLKELEAFIRLQSTGSGLNKADKALLDKRLEQHKANPEAGKPWDGLKAELMSRYGL